MSTVEKGVDRVYLGTPKKEIKATDDNLIVLPDPAEEEKTEAGVILPENMRNKPRTGTIVAVGPGERRSDNDQRIPMESEVGERIMFGARAGIAATIDGINYIILKERETLVVLNK